MNDPQTMSGARRSHAVTLLGILIVLVAIFVCVVTALFAFEVIGPRVAVVGISKDLITADAAPAVLFPISVIFGFVGIAMVRRWRGWRIWSGAAAWIIIAISILGLFAPPTGDRARDLIGRSIIVVFAIAVLLAKRSERDAAKTG